MIGTPPARTDARIVRFLLCERKRQYLSDHTDGWSAIFSARVLTEIRPLSLRYRASHATSFSLFFSLLSFTFYKHPFLYVANEQLEANIFRCLQHRATS